MSAPRLRSTLSRRRRLRSTFSRKSRTLARAVPVKGIVVVHGVGTARQSDTLLDLGEPLLRWVERWMAVRGRAVRFERAGLAFRRTDDGARTAPPHVSLRVEGGSDPRRPGRTEREDGLHWVMAEAWWAASSRRPGFWLMYFWIMRHLLQEVWHLLGVLADRALRLGLYYGGQPADAPAAPRERPGWQPVVIDAGVRAIDFVNTVLLVALCVVGLAVSFAVVAILLLLTQVPIQSVQDFVLFRGLRTFLSANAGEMRTLLTDPIQAANLRGRVEAAMRWLVTEAGCTDIYIIAHSGGVPVSFEMLCRPDDPALARRVRKFFSLGQGLNQAWLLAPKPDREDGPAGWTEKIKRPFWRLGGGLHQSWLQEPELGPLRGPIERHIGWLDFWATYDPVPAGPLKPPSRGSFRPYQPDAAIAGGMCLPAQRHPHRRPSLPPSCEVTNRMSILADHGGYWTNDEEVLSRLAQEIDTPHYQRSRFWPEPVRQEAAVRSRRRRVGVLAGMRLGALLLAAGTVAGRWAGLQEMGTAVWRWLSLY